MMSDRSVEATVLELVQRFSPGKRVSPDTRFIEDLGLSSDDFTAIALRLEKMFEFRADRRLWSKAFTIRDVISVVANSRSTC
jgi:acyl carrier protein